MSSSLRGYYRCTACGAKVRLASKEAIKREQRAIEYERADNLLDGLFDGIAATWELACSVVVDLGRAARWLYRKISRKLRVKEQNTPQITPAEVVLTLAAWGAMSARYQSVGKGRPARGSSD